MHVEVFFVSASRQRLPRHPEYPHSALRVLLQLLLVLRNVSALRLSASLSLSKSAWNCRDEAAAAAAAAAEMTADMLRATDCAASRRPCFVNGAHEYHTVMEQCPIRLPCTILNTNFSNTVITWWKVKSLQEISLSTQIRRPDKYRLPRATREDWSLIVRRASQSDAGDYVCQINLPTLEEKVFTVKVHSRLNYPQSQPSLPVDEKYLKDEQSHRPPKSVITSSIKMSICGPFRVLENQPVKLVCNATFASVAHAESHQSTDVFGTPLSSYTLVWLRDGRTMRTLWDGSVDISVRQYSVDRRLQSTIRLSRASKETTAGNWMCVCVRRSDQHRRIGVRVRLRGGTRRQRSFAASQSFLHSIDMKVQVVSGSDVDSQADETRRKSGATHCFSDDDDEKPRTTKKPSDLDLFSITSVSTSGCASALISDFWSDPMSLKLTSRTSPNLPLFSYSSEASSSSSSSSALSSLLTSAYSSFSLSSSVSSCVCRLFANTWSFTITTKAIHTLLSCSKMTPLFCTFFLTHYLVVL